MRKQYKQNLLTVSVLFVLIAFVLQHKYCSKESPRVSSHELAYKKLLLEQDSLRKEDSITYTRLVNDMYKEREFAEMLESENQYLYQKLKDTEKKVVSLTKIVGKLKNKKSKVEFVKKDGITYFEDYYPKKENYFVRYKAQVEENFVIGEFVFQPLRLDLVIAEREKGVFEAYLNAPSWLEVGSLEVKSLPMQSPSLKIDNFDWVFGGSLGYSYLNRTPLVGLSGGFRYKRLMYYLQGTSNQSFYFGVNQFF